MNTPTEQPRIYTVLERDDDGVTYAHHRWLTTEQHARTYFARYCTSPTARLIGRGGMVLA
jgi:hypothetical protein